MQSSDLWMRPSTTNLDKSTIDSEALIPGWTDILVSDGYGDCCKGVQGQSYLAHLLRKARELSERIETEIASAPGLRRNSSACATWRALSLTWVSGKPLMPGSAD